MAVKTINGISKVEKAHNTQRLKTELETLNGAGVIGDDAFLFIGYPMLSRDVEVVERLDSLLVSRDLNIIGFDVMGTDEDDIDEDELESRQSEIYRALLSRLQPHKELSNGKKFIPQVSIVTYDARNSDTQNDVQHDDYYYVSAKGELADLIGAIIQGSDRLSDEMYRATISVVQAFSKARPQKKRKKAITAGSLGSISKKIEKEISNMDADQFRAVIEAIDHPQRIKGLAGTGKTVVLAAKAAYLHKIDEDLDILVTFYSKSLYGQYKNLITRFYRDFSDGEEPNWDKIRIMHSWGAQDLPGAYRLIAEENGIKAMRFSQTQNENLKKIVDPFEMCCDDLIEKLKDKTNKAEIFDIALIDEGQDLPRSFYESVFYSTKPVDRTRLSSRRIIWAYDENQRVSEAKAMPEPEELFGSANGEPNVSFATYANRAAADIRLTVCYRNPKEIITTAHALCLKFYGDGGPINQLDSVLRWREEGYDITAGASYIPGEKVTLVRSPETSPTFLSEYLQGTHPILATAFQTRDEQAEWIATQIKENLTRNELELSDIIIINPVDPLSLSSTSGELQQALLKHGIPFEFAGRKDPSVFFTEHALLISHIFRAKGNEAPMVYVMNSDLLNSGKELIVKRNTLFTAITRAKSWVRLCGIGEEMNQLIEEVRKVHHKHYSLEFNVMTDDELATKRKQYGELPKHAKDKKDRTVSKLRYLLRDLDLTDLDQSDVRANFTPEEIALIQGIMSKKQ